MFLFKSFQLKLICERNELTKFLNLIILGLSLVSPKTFGHLDGALTINHIVYYKEKNDVSSQLRV
jgi:hypothetical protein